MLCKRTAVWLGQHYPQSRGLRRLLRLTAVLTAIGLALAWWMPWRCSCRCLTPLRQCQSNQQILATALEMYASDHAGTYPSSPEALVRAGYLKVLPTCPAARRETYSATYRLERNEYAFYCRGAYHLDDLKRRNLPRYSASEGLILR